MEMRFHELDSLRGLAAISVLMGHCLGVLLYMGNTSYVPHMLLLNLLKFTPATIIEDGASGVILFFVLSGFVLSIPYHNSNNMSYKPFIIRRIFRLYAPYVITLSIAIIIRSVISYRIHPDLSTWLNDQWRSPVTLGLILNHLAFVLDYTFGGGGYDIAAFDSVIWSLVQEMRISLIFPLLALLVLRMNWKTSLGFAIVCSVIYYVLNYIGLNHKEPSLIAHITSLLSTFEWIPMFVVGALLARHWNTIVRFINKRPVSIKIFMATLGLLCYTEPTWMPQNVNLLQINIVHDWFVLFGSTLFILLSLSSKLLSKILHLKPILYIGKISYSLYLYHLVILIGMMQLFYGEIPLGIIWLITLALSLVVGSLSYTYIELPSIRVGKRIANKTGLVRRTPKVIAAG